MLLRSRFRRRSVAAAVFLSATCGVGVASPAHADDGSASAFRLVSDHDDNTDFSWEPTSVDGVLDQALISSDVETGATGPSLTVAPWNSGGALHTSDGLVLSGHTYAVSVVTRFADGTSHPSGSVLWTAGEKVPSTPSERPVCTIDQRTRVLSVHVPTSPTEDATGRHVVLSRSITIWRNDPDIRPFTRLTASGAAASTVTMPVRFGPGDGSPNTRYWAAYQLVDAAGTSALSGQCTASLLTARTVRMRAGVRVIGSRIHVAWNPVRFPDSPVTGHEVRWWGGNGREHVLRLGPDSRSASIPLAGLGPRIVVVLTATSVVGPVGRWDSQLTRSAGRWS